MRCRQSEQNVNILGATFVGKIRVEDLRRWQSENNSFMACAKLTFLASKTGLLYCLLHILCIGGLTCILLYTNLGTGQKKTDITNRSEQLEGSRHRFQFQECNISSMLDFLWDVHCYMFVT